MSRVITSSFTDLHSQTASIFVNFLESHNQEELCFIKTTKLNTTIPPKKSLRFTCRANTRLADEANPWPNGLEISGTLLTVTKGNSHQVDIDITRNTNHEIVLRDKPYLANYNLHISNICKKASERIGVIMRLRNHIPTEAKLNLFKAAVLSHPTHCHLVWQFCRASDTLVD